MPSNIASALADLGLPAKTIRQPGDEMDLKRRPPYSGLLAEIKFLPQFSVFKIRPTRHAFIVCLRYFAETSCDKRQIVSAGYRP